MRKARGDPYLTVERAEGQRDQHRKSQISILGLWAPGHLWSLVNSIVVWQPLKTLPLAHLPLNSYYLLKVTLEVKAYSAGSSEANPSH